MIICADSTPGAGWSQRAGLNSKASGPQIDRDMCRPATLTRTAHGTGRLIEDSDDCPSGMVWTISLDRIKRDIAGNSRRVSSWGGMSASMLPPQTKFYISLTITAKHRVS